MWHRLQRETRLPPRRQSAHYNERFESGFPQQMRHPGASRFACSSAVEINIPGLAEILDLFRQVVGLKPN